MFLLLASVALPVAGSIAAGAGEGAVDRELVPAGSINSVLSSGPHVVVVGDDPDVARYGQQIQRSFFPDARVLDAVTALETDLTGVNVLVYGSPQDHAWIVEYEERLPIRFEEGALELDGKRFEGDHLRAILALDSPQDPHSRVVLYVAPDPADVPGINDLFHGPTEWLVADGARVLGAGSYLATGPLPVEVLRTDLDYLVATLEAVHPATANGTPESVQDAIRAARAAIGAPLDRLSFWRVANRVLLSLHDAHTRAAPLTSGETIDLPLAWLEEGLFVARSTPRLERGDRVVAIGGRTPEVLLERLADLVPAETPHWLRHHGERDLASAGILRELGVEFEAEVTVSLERGGAKLEVRLPLGEAVTAEAGRAWARFELDEAHDLAVFTLDRCVVDDFYRGQVRAFFDAVTAAGIGRIAVDVRANSGGNSGVVDEFLRYLDLDEYSSYSGAIRVSEQSIERRGSNGMELGYHEFGPQTRTNPPVEGATRFGGEVFVLTSNGTFSSGNWFAVVLQDNGIGTVVGEPTGNAPSAFGDLLQFELPGSGLSFGMSYKRWIRPDPTRDPASCVEPDRHVPRTREDLIAGHDPVLAALREP